jgi:hypothetical protein
MEFSFSKEEEKFRQEVQEFLQQEVTEDLVAETEANVGFGPHTWAFLRKLGAKGWLAPAVPKEYGGMGASHMQRLILTDELLYHRAIPITLCGASIVAPTLLLYGNEEQKREYLPRIARGEIEFALGYSEPNAGSDLAALEITAVEDGDDFVLNGHKIFNTGTHYAHYVWMAARTDPTLPKHKGISLLIVDTKSPGITIRPLWTMDGERTNEVFYQDVRVPKKNLVGEKNRGFYYITTALAFERNFPIGLIRRTFEELVEYARETTRLGKPLIKDPWVRQGLAQLKIELEAAHLLAYRVAWMTDKKMVPEWEAPMIKMFGTELMHRLGNTGIQIMGLYGLLEQPSKWVPLKGRIEHMYRHASRRTISAGTNEIMRNTIALRGLKLPRS